MVKPIDILYQRYLRGELSSEELEKFRRLVTETTDNELWDLMCLDFVNASETTRMPSEAKQNLLANIEQETQTKCKPWLVRYVAAAVVALVVLVGGYAWYVMNDASASNFATITVKPGQKASAVLPDGTRVDLNGGTQLRYDVVPGKRREVLLCSGEAFFDVAKDANCPFHVRANGMQVEVLGARFNVKPMTGRPASSGCSRSSTEAKKASMSTWMMGVAESSSPQDRRAARERGALLISTSSTSATCSPVGRTR